MHAHVNIAITALRRAGNIMTRAHDPKQRREAEANILQDIMTTIDKTHQDHNIQTPDEFIDEDSPHTWWIEPIAGQLNYLHGFNYFATSIIKKYNDTPEHCVIYDPMLQDIYVASIGARANRNEMRIRTNNDVQLNDALLAVELDDTTKYDPILKQAAGWRTLGCPLLSLAQVAAGDFDGFIGENLSDFAIAAGNLFMAESGGYISDPGRETIAAPRKFYTKLVK